MIKAGHHWFYESFFNWYTYFMLRKHFDGVEIDGEWKVSGEAALVIGNHFSWWDGFIALYLNRLLLKKKFHIMMLEKQLKSRMFLNKLGAFSIKPGTRSVLSSIEYTGELLQEKQNTVVMYPQGKFSSMSSPSFYFGSGVIKIMEQNPQAEILFYVALVDYFDKPKPGLYLYLKKVTRNDVESIPEKFESFYKEAVKKQSMKVR